MEAKELMIGDWYFDQELEKNRRWQQLQFSEAYGNPTYMSFIRPIPLTPEILEKNGYEWRLDCYHYPDYVTIEKEGSGYLVRCSNYKDGQRKAVSLRIYYVHELQHALRLCGLTGLADNFKL